MQPYIANQMVPMSDIKYKTLISQDPYYGKLTNIVTSGIYPWVIGSINPGKGVPCAKGWHSYKCRCDMEPISCTPRDEYTVVIECDNTQSAEPTECNYIKVLGYY